MIDYKQRFVSIDDKVKSIIKFAYNNFENVKDISKAGKEKMTNKPLLVMLFIFQPQRIIYST